MQSEWGNRVIFFKTFLKNYKFLKKIFINKCIILPLNFNLINSKKKKKINLNYLGCKYFQESTLYCTEQ